jgi:hypothetical protein
MVIAKSFHKYLLALPELASGAMDRGAGGEVFRDFSMLTSRTTATTLCRRIVGLNRVFSPA